MRVQSLWPRLHWDYYCRTSGASSHRQLFIFPDVLHLTLPLLSLLFPFDISPFLIPAAPILNKPQTLLYRHDGAMVIGLESME